MNTKLKSHRKKFGTKKLSLSYSSDTIPTLNKLDSDSSTFKRFECSKVFELDNKPFKGKLPPLVNHGYLVTKTNEGKIMRKNYSEQKIRPSETKLLGKIDSNSFSISSSNLIMRVGLPKIQTESEDYSCSESGRKNQSLIIEETYTPTFRNIYCENETIDAVNSGKYSSHEKKESIYSFSDHKLSKNGSSKGLIKMSSHFIHGIRNMGLLLKEPMPAFKKVKKIKVLEHKFPKDMFC